MNTKHFYNLLSDIVDVDYLPKEKEVLITNRGMITIPARLRKQYDLKDGDKVLIIEDEGTLKIIPIRSTEDLRKDSFTVKEMLDHIEKSKEEAIEREG
ncbi:MAG: AbrB/MazE/SpoVT family DNA-binding domain-containing protein [Candidatus Lokiarchaeota archaeon]|nr:AbrB/MazE/SpoVT family DNA-binding domain-containing protein [Candidatus Lokiarchaeota archaeon]